MDLTTSEGRQVCCAIWATVWVVNHTRCETRYCILITVPYINHHTLQHTQPLAATLSHAALTSCRGLKTLRIMAEVRESLRMWLKKHSRMSEFEQNDENKRPLISRGFVRPLSFLSMKNTFLNNLRLLLSTTCKAFIPYMVSPSHTHIITVFYTMSARAHTSVSDILLIQISHQVCGSNPAELNYSLSLCDEGILLACTTRWQVSGQLWLVTEGGASKNLR